MPSERDIENIFDEPVNGQDPKDKAEDPLAHLTEVQRSMVLKFTEHENHWFLKRGVLRENVIIGDIFTVVYLDRYGKKFDRVSRIEATSRVFNIEMVLDFNSELMRMGVDAKLKVTIAKNLNGNGEYDKDEASYLEPPSWDCTQETALADFYHYVMHGKIYRYEENKDGDGTVYISFGGLLLSLTAPHTLLVDFKLNQYVYLLVDYHTDNKDLARK